jgi:phage terminase small subunit
MAANASARLEPTSALDAVEREHFDGIVATRETATWSRHDRALATTLAKIMGHIDKIESAMRVEGYTQTGRSGERTHPLVTALMQTTQAMQALTRTLGLSASQRALTSDRQRGRNEADATARDVINRVAVDDLLG